MNWKIIFIGGVVFYITQFLVSFITGPLIHEGILEPLYMATTEFWRPELTQDPPDMAALMPRWITVGVIMSFVLAGIYGVVRRALSGSGWLKGIKYGFILGLIVGSAMAGWSGVFNLPGEIWLWWAAESFVYFIIGGAALGFVAQKLVPEHELDPGI